MKRREARPAPGQSFRPSLPSSLYVLLAEGRDGPGSKEC